MIDSDETASIPLRLESDGTLKMFALYPVLQEVLERGSVLFIDELNARLHPLLVKNFMTDREISLGNLLSKIADELNITPTMQDKAVKSYESVGKWIGDGVNYDSIDTDEPSPILS